MTDGETLSAFVEGTDVVIHTAYDSAAESQQLKYFRSNIFGSLTLLEFSRLAGVRQFICTTSTYLLRPDVYTPSDVRQTLITEDSPAGISPEYLCHAQHGLGIGMSDILCTVQHEHNRFPLCMDIWHSSRSGETVWRDILEIVQPIQSTKAHSAAMLSLSMPL